MIKIIRWDTGELIYESITAKNIKEAVQEAVKKKVSLTGAELSGADFFEANLSRAKLSEANFFEANLSRAELSGADLYEANLSRANLSRANLSRANLSFAELSGANLSETELSGANLFFVKMCPDVFKQITRECFEWKITKKDSEDG